MTHLTNRGIAERTDRIRKLRDAALQLVERYGEWGETNIRRIRTGRQAPFLVVSTTPFQRRPQASDDVKYLRALRAAQGAPVRLERACGVDVWADLRVGAKLKPLKVLSLGWNEGSAIDVVTFKRGSWERELLALTVPEASA